ncbi:MAG: hypothetical protein M5R42_16570 [Rhodocyclaceae bacterium]|nr:hypothetical protein [Rhodocyclaceae bacterium]
MQKDREMPDRDHFTDARQPCGGHVAKEPDKDSRADTEHSRESQSGAIALFDPDAKAGSGAACRRLRHLFSVGAGYATALDDIADHEPWLASRRADIEWRFWNRYMTYLERDFGDAAGCGRQT